MPCLPTGRIPIPNPARRFTRYGPWRSRCPKRARRPEQTLVLGMGAGRRAPSWDESRNQFVPVIEANLTLSFDHRVLDGGAAGRLLARVAALLNEPETL